MSQVATGRVPGATSSTFARVGAALVIAQALVGLVIAVLTSTVYPQSHELGAPAFYSWGAVLTAMHVLLLVGVATLVGRRAAGRGILATIAYAIVLGGLALQALAEAVLRFSFSTGNTMFSIVVPLLAVGLILLGVAIVRAGTWRGWSRVAPFAAGLYIPVVLLPAFALSGGVSFPAIGGWQLFFVALGVAMWSEADR